MTRHPPKRPPRILSRLLRHLLPGPVGDEVLEALREEYAERCAAAGRLRADIWYAAHLLRPGTWGLARRLAARRARGGTSTEDRLVSELRSAVPTLPPVETIIQNVRHTIRRLLRAPTFTAAAVVSLALAIGANTAVFSLANATLFSGRGIVHPDRVAQVFRNHGSAVTWNDYRAMRDDLPGVFADATTYREEAIRLDDSDDVTAALRVSGDYFDVVGVAPALGRAFVQGEETDVVRDVDIAVISWDLWQRRYRGDPNIVGREIRVNARPTTVVGVLPEDFTVKLVGIAMDVLLTDPGAVRRPDVDNLWASGRLVEGVSMEQVRAGMARIAAAYNEDRPASLDPITFNVVSEANIRVAPGLDHTMISMTALLFAMVGLVLLIACSNLASFLLARAMDRRKEFAVRIAIGAGRGRVLSQLLGESLLLSALGGVAGLFLAVWGVKLLLRFQPPAPVPLNFDVPLDLRVLAFTVSVSLLAGILFGVFPALQASRAPVASILRDESGRGKRWHRSWSVRGLLVSGQVTLSLVLLVVAGLFLRSLLAAIRVDPGFEPQGVAVVTVEPGTSGYDDEEGRQLYTALLERARQLPGVEAASLGSRIPLEPFGNWRSGVRRTDVVATPRREYRWPQIVRISPDYFATLGIEIVQGRDFSGADALDAPPVVILNEAAVRDLWGEGAGAERAVGEPVVLSSREDAPARVVGVVRNSKLKTPGEDTEPLMYLPVTQSYDGTTKLLARGRGPAMALAESLRTVAKELDPDLYVHDAMTARESMSTALFLPRMATLLFAVLGGLALVMSAIGLYGMVGYQVATRKWEVGVRLSLGASSIEVVREMMSGGLRMVAAGLILGLGLAAGAGLLVERFLFGVRGADPLTLVIAPLVLLAVAGFAAWVPARRAARIDPMEALRSP